MLVDAANELKNLKKSYIIELRSFAAPPQKALDVVSAVMYALGRKKKSETDKTRFAEFKKIDPTQFIQTLQFFDKDNMSLADAKQVKKMLEGLTYTNVRACSVAASIIYKWVFAIATYVEAVKSE